MYTFFYYLGIGILLTISTMASLGAIFTIIDKLFGIDSDSIYHYKYYEHHKYYVNSEDENEGV